MKLTPVIGAGAIIIGILYMLFCSFNKARFKRELNKKIQEYNISGKELEEIVVACGYLINVKGKILKL